MNPGGPDRPHRLASGTKSFWGLAACAAAIAMEARDAAGSGFRYDGVPFQIFGELLRRKLATTGEDALGYLPRRILDPIGMKADG